MESFIILINTLLFIINPFKNYIYLNIKYNLKKLIYIYIYIYIKLNIYLSV